MKKINNYIKEIRSILSLSTSAYDSWWTLCGADSQKYKDIMVTFPTHFKLSKYSYICIVITTLFMLLEDKNKTINIKELLRLITPEKQFKPRDIKLLKEKIEKSEVIWKKICILRHNQFAHFNYQLSMSGPFKKANIKPEEFKVFISQMEEIINYISQKYNGSVHAFNPDDKYSTKQFMDSLIKTY